MHANRWVNLERGAFLLVAALGTLVLLQILAYLLPDPSSHEAGDAMLALILFAPFLMLALSGAALAWAVSTERAGRRAVIAWGLFALATTAWLVPAVGLSGPLGIVLSPNTTSWQIQWPLLEFSATDGSSGSYNVDQPTYLLPIVVVAAAVVAIVAAFRAPSPPGEVGRG